MKMEVEAGSSLLHDITKAAARLCVLVCNPFARSAGIFFLSEVKLNCRGRRQRQKAEAEGRGRRQRQEAEARGRGRRQEAEAGAL